LSSNFYRTIINWRPIWALIFSKQLRFVTTF
jgi:hypothetical protein